MQYKTDEKTAEFYFRNIKMKLSCPLNNVWRIQTETDGLFDDMGAAQTLKKDLGEPYTDSPAEITVTENNGRLIISTAETRAEITESEIAFYGKTGLIRRLTDIRHRKDGAEYIFLLSSGESIYGSGERFDHVDRRGLRAHNYAIDKWCRTHGNSYIPIPFVMSTAGGGMFFNRYEHSIFDAGFTSKDKFRVTQKYAPLDLYVFTSSEPEKILYDYCTLTGFAPVPPQWAFGTLVCRYHPEFGTPEGILAMAENMEKNGFPWEAVITEGWGTYDKPRHEEFKSVIEKIHAMGKKVMVYEQCGKYPFKAEEYFGLDDSFAVKGKNGTLLRETRSMNLVDNFHHKKMRCIDLTDERAVDKWESIWSYLMNDIGVDGAKIDFCEQFPDKPFIKFADGRDPMAAHHWFPTLYSTLRYKHFNTRSDGGITFARGGGIGSQRFPFVWAGDQRREFFFLKAVLKAALSLGLSGVPFVSWDMAGYQPSYNPFDYIHEDRVFIRGMEFAAFSLNIQTHGKVKRPYDFDENTRAIYKKYADIHEELRSYLYEQAKKTSETGLPVMRHLWLYSPEDKNVYGIEDEYMLGDELLVAPVLDNKLKRDIYLPEGTWENYFTHKKFRGNQTLYDYDVPLDSIAVFKLIRE